MKKLVFSILFISYALICVSVDAAVTVKKAAPVATKQASVTDTTASLLPTVINLVSNVQALNAQTKALTAECIPTSQEITFVNNIVKEWAKTGAMNADEAEKKMGYGPCRSATGGYRGQVEQNALSDTQSVLCYDWFDDKNSVWYKFPQVGVGYYCSDGSLIQGCSEKNKKTVSNIYDVFNLVDFVEADYTPTEATMAGKMIAKIEKCSNAKLSAKKRELWGNFLVTTIGGVGQKTNTATIMDSVTNLTSGGGLSFIGSIATQFLDR